MYVPITFTYVYQIHANITYTFMFISHIFMFINHIFMFIHYIFMFINNIFMFINHIFMYPALSYLNICIPTCLYMFITIREITC